MHRKVYLEGEMGVQFGREFTIAATTYQDVLKCIEVNRPGLREYLIECHEKDIGFTFDTAGKGIDQIEDMVLPLQEGDITITAIPAGSGSGIGKILTAIAIIAILMTPGLREAMMLGNGLSGTAATLTIGGKMVAGFAISLAMQGLAQMMAPDPSIDDPHNPENYLFNGARLNAEEGDPMPLLYGELRVPGRQASLHVTGGYYQNSNALLDSLGNVYQTDSRNEPDKRISKEEITGGVS